MFLNILYYTDAREALLKAIMEWCLPAQRVAWDIHDSTAIATVGE